MFAQYRESARILRENPGAGRNVRRCVEMVKGRGAEKIRNGCAQ